MSDVLSNALVRGLKMPPGQVRAFLDEAQAKYADGTSLMKAAAAHFKLAESLVASKVEKYRHVNCSHPVESPLYPLLRVDPNPNPNCDIDLMQSGNMSDIVSNALVLGLSQPADEVRVFLERAAERFEDGQELFLAAAARFTLTEDVLAAAVQKYRHINCEHIGGGRDRTPPPDDGLPIPAFARDVTLHVVLHELAHGLIREFDIPVLGNEETCADAFATYYLTTHLPDRAVDVLSARVTSLLIEAEEDFKARGTRGGGVGGVEWSGEHDHDARRANQIAALAIAADPVKYKAVGDLVGMSDRARANAVDYGSEIRRSWRRTLAPLWMPDGTASDKASIQFDRDNSFLARLCAESDPHGLAADIANAVGRFDWHSPITVRIVDGGGGAAWSRSSRSITVNSEYVRRFINQSHKAPTTSK